MVPAFPLDTHANIYLFKWHRQIFSAARLLAVLNTFYKQLYSTNANFYDPHWNVALVPVGVF